MVPVKHIDEVCRPLVRLTGLWEAQTTNGRPYFSGRLSESSKVLIFESRAGDQADWTVFVTSSGEVRGPLVKVGELTEQRTREKGERYLSGCWGSARLLLFENTLRVKPQEPSHVLYIAPNDPPRRPKTLAVTPQDSGEKK